MAEERTTGLGHVMRTWLKVTTDAQARVGTWWEHPSGKEVFGVAEK